MASLPAFVILFYPLHPDLRVGGDREPDRGPYGYRHHDGNHTVLCKNHKLKMVGGVAFEEREKG